MISPKDVINDPTSIKVAHFSHEPLGKCEFPMAVNWGPDYVTECQEPAIAKGTWWAEREPFRDEHMLLCLEHLTIVEDAEAKAEAEGAQNEKD